MVSRRMWTIAKNSGSREVAGDGRSKLRIWITMEPTKYCKQWVSSRAETIAGPNCKNWRQEMISYSATRTVGHDFGQAMRSVTMVIIHSLSAQPMDGFMI